MKLHPVDVLVYAVDMLLNADDVKLTVEDAKLTIARGMATVYLVRSGAAALTALCCALLNPRTHLAIVQPGGSQRTVKATYFLTGKLIELKWEEPE